MIADPAPPEDHALETGFESRPWALLPPEVSVALSDPVSSAAPKSFAAIPVHNSKRYRKPAFTCEA